MGMALNYDYDQYPSLLEYQKTIGVDMNGVIAGNDAEQEQLVEVVRKYPDKFYGIGYVDVHNMFESLKKISAYIEEGSDQRDKNASLCAIVSARCARNLSSI